MNILFIGDVVGQLGQQALAQRLGQLRDKHKIDFVIANGENLAYGLDMTRKTLEDLLNTGVDFITSGNHWAKQSKIKELTNADKIPFIRPANYPADSPGQGYKIVTVRTKTILIINLMGRVFIEGDFANPFRKLDQIIRETQSQKPDVILVDFHAEATSEKKAFGFYADGRVTAVLGTHTHVPTADAIVLPRGTGYVTDVGMVGPRQSVLGLNPSEIIHHFLTDEPFTQKIAAGPEVCLNYAVIHTTDKHHQNGVAQCGALVRHSDIIKID